MGGAFSLSAKSIVGDMSEYHVNIDSTFQGKNLVLFGAQNDPGDLHIVVRGPERNVTIRKKEKSPFGIWINKQQSTFERIPYYFSHNSFREFDAGSPLFQALDIGLDSLSLHVNESLSLKEREEFVGALRDLMKGKGLYRDHQEMLTFMGDTLFKTLVSFPDTLPRGSYAVDVYLIEDGKLRAQQTLPIAVDKVGFDAFLYDLAHDNSMLYALMAIGIALSVGWAISQLFSRIV